MDVYKILGELRKEREQIEESILAVERLARVVTAQGRETSGRLVRLLE